MVQRCYFNGLSYPLAKHRPSSAYRVCVLGRREKRATSSALSRLWRAVFGAVTLSCGTMPRQRFSDLTKEQQKIIINLSKNSGRGAQADPCMNEIRALLR